MHGGGGGRKNNHDRSSEVLELNDCTSLARFVFEEHGVPKPSTSLLCLLFTN